MGKNKIGTKPKNRFYLLKRLIGLMSNKAPLKQYWLEVGVYFLKKGVSYEIGQIIQEKHLRDNMFRVKIITGLFYDFRSNKVTHTAENRIVKNEKV